MNPVKLPTCNRPIEASGQNCLRVSGHTDLCEPDPTIAMELDGKTLFPTAESTVAQAPTREQSLEVEAALEAFPVMLELAMEDENNNAIAYEQAAKNAITAGRAFDRVVGERQDELDPKLRSIVRNEIRTLEDAAEVLRLDPKRTEDVRGVLLDCVSALRLVVEPKDDATLDQESRSSA